MTGKQFVIPLFLLLLVTECPAKDFLVGAIRWDAWYGDGSGVNREVEKTLSPRQWQWRAPFFAEVVEENELEIRGRAEDLQKEIDYAADAGIDYWSFCIYDPDINLSRALQWYLEAPNRDRINFCLNLQGGHMSFGGLQQAKKRIDLYVNYMKRQEYQLVLEGRPLIYVFNLENAIGTKALGSESELKEFFHTFRSRAIECGLQNPYIVVQAQPERAYQYALKYGADAIGHYAVMTHWENQTYQQLTDYTEGYFWSEYLSKKMEMVPIATAGWDNRPRIETGVFWQPELKDKSITEFHAPAKLKELAEHIRNALSFLKKNADQTPAQTILIYAWNEFDEGGWLCPTLGEDTSRLDALKPILNDS